jgi:hypothetical protein
MSKLFLIVALVCLVVGAVAGAYWGTQYSHTAVALRRTRQTICPSVPVNTTMKEFPKACRDAMISPNRE